MTTSRITSVLKQLIRCYMYQILTVCMFKTHAPILDKIDTVYLRQIHQSRFCMEPVYTSDFQILDVYIEVRQMLEL